MEDMANIIDDVGIDTLKRQLGINMSSNNMSSNKLMMHL